MPGHYHYGPVNADITATSVTASDTAAKVCRFPIMRSIGSKSIYIHYAFDRATTRRLPYTKCGRTFKMKDTLIQYQGEAHAGLDYLWLLDSGTISGFPTTFEADLTERIHNIHASRPVAVAWPMKRGSGTTPGLHIVGSFRGFRALCGVPMATR